VGSAVAEAFVRGLAEATGGACEFVAPREDMAERIHRHFQRMYAPRARSAVVRWPARAVRSLPQSIETVYGGDTVHIFAWFAERPEGNASLEVTLVDGRAVSQRTQILAIDESLAETPPSKDAMPSTLARIGTARRIIAMNDDRAGMELALHYQLMSQWTNYVVVHVRADAEKAEDLPKIVRVPQVLAAGWHGMGTVHAERGLALRACYDLAPSPLHVLDSARRSMSPQAYSQPAHMAAAVAIGPAELVALLNARAMSSSPTLNDFEVWGAPEAVLMALRDLVDQGEDEAIVVAAFLYLLACSEAGKVLDRRVRRRVLKAYKTKMPNQAVMDAVTCTFDGWQSQGATEEIGR
jgi:Ca-activated chloride channel family protein